ncbi:lachesin isoform X1 [Osmia lignaria lignaria]|uniref:lachesin isoform X1 n=1 Tax=Osmia lignaria lignaria TaxID=1437193 RepID=UPI0014782B14|nr:lachesin-like isoform X1 [Osmia lignaria]
MAYGLFYGMASRDIVLCFFLAAFLYSSFGQAMPKSEVQPEFLALLENHTVTQGRDVSFTCVVNHLQSYKVAWIKSDSKAILAIHTHMVAHNPRLSVTHNGHNTWKLHVTNVQPNDSGTYMCQVNTDPMRSQTGHMKVVIPPDIMDLDDSADLTAKENSDLRLRCRATGTPKPTVTWRREDGRNITLRTEHGVQRVKSYEGEELHLRGILRQEMGSYLCIASNGVPPTVSKRYYVNVRCKWRSRSSKFPEQTYIINNSFLGAVKPLIKVSNELVAAPANSDVVLHCYVESSPKALNTWYREDGIKLLPDEKHNLSEVTLNDYAYQLNFTIKRLNRDDFGSYTCSAENLLGKADGTIRLQESHLTRTTSVPIRNTEFIGKHGPKKQTDRKGKLHLFGREGAGSLSKNSGNIGHTTPMLRRNSSNALTDSNAKKSKVSSYPAPAPAPANFAPTQLNVQNSVTSSRHSRLNCVGLMLAFIVIVICSS